jgi:hypothetical protein
MSYFRTHTGGKLASLLDSYSANAQVSNPVQYSAPINSSTKSTILTIAMPSEQQRNGGSPTLGGTSFIQAGSYSGDKYVEIWYLNIVNPDTTPQTLSIPNTGGNNIAYSLTQYNAELVIENHLFESGLDEGLEMLVTLTTNKYLLLVQSVVMNYYNGNKVGAFTRSDTMIHGGVGGGVFGFFAQYKRYFNLSDTSYTMWVNWGATLSGQAVVAVFKTI